MIVSKYTSFNNTIKQYINFLYDNVTGEGGMMNYFFESYAYNGVAFYLIFYSGLVN